MELVCSRACDFDLVMASCYIRDSTCFKIIFIAFSVGALNLLLNVYGLMTHNYLRAKIKLSLCGLFVAISNVNVGCLLDDVLLLIVFV